jgi:RHS repeat-associated protein
MRTVYGVPADLSVPDDYEPTPWVTTVYDRNDLAPVSTGRNNVELTRNAPATHHFTPTSCVVDALGRVLCKLDRCGYSAADWHATLSSYDVRGNLLTITDALGRTAFRQVYDFENRQLSVVSIDEGERFSVLDAAGNLRQTRDSRGCMALRTYDSLNRLSRLFARDRPEQKLSVRVSVIYGDGGDPKQPAANRVAARAANRLGRRWRQYDEAGLVVIDRYDFTGKTIRQTRQVISDTAIAAAESAGGWTADWAAANATATLDAQEYRTEQSHDALDRVIELIAPPDPTGHQAHIVPTYNQSGALRAIAVDGVTYVNLIAYNAQGQRVLIEYGNGLMTRYAYDPETFRLTRLRSEDAKRSGNVWSATGRTRQDLTYSYDLAGNLSAIDERVAGCGIKGSLDGPDRLVRMFAYDPLYRLISATGRALATIGQPRPVQDYARFGAPPVPDQVNAPNLSESYTETYCYDPAGNLLDLGYEAPSGQWHRRFGIGGQRDTECARQSAEWKNASNNRLTTVRAGSLTLEFNYDEVGNLKSENLGRAYTWDYAGRLIAFQVAAGSEPSMAARYLYGADGTRVKKWVSRNNNHALYESTTYLGRLIEYHRWTTNGGGNNSVLHVMDGSSRIALIHIGQKHPDYAGPPISYHLKDHLGSGAVIVDSVGQWVSREEYFPFGETSFGAFAKKRYRFSGKERDEESGFYYHGARFYAPSLTRWVTCDPASVRDGESLYRYALNNPLGYVDLNGAQATPEPHRVSQEQVITGDAATGVGFGAASSLSQTGGNPPTGGEPEPQEPSKLRENLELLAGIVFGTVQSLTPLGFLMKSPAPESRPFEIGRGGGQLATGIVQFLGGAAIATAGAGVDVLGVGGSPFTLGGSLVLELPGTAAIVAGLAISIYGSINVASGAITLSNAMAMSSASGGAGPGGGTGAPSSGGSGSGGRGRDPAAEKIANGHAYDKHVVKGKEFPEVKDKSGFSDVVDRVMQSPENKALSNGRHAYWEDTTKTVVIRNPADPDGGTCFRPVLGKAYYDGLK